MNRFPMSNQQQSGKRTFFLKQQSKFQPAKWRRQVMLLLKAALSRYFHKEMTRKLRRMTVILNGGGAHEGQRWRKTLCSGGRQANRQSPLYSQSQTYPAVRRRWDIIKTATHLTVCPFHLWGKKILYTVTTSVRLMWCFPWSRWSVSGCNGPRYRGVISLVEYFVQILNMSPLL